MSLKEFKCPSCRKSINNILGKRQMQCPHCKCGVEYNTQTGRWRKSSGAPASSANMSFTDKAAGIIAGISGGKSGSETKQPKTQSQQKSDVAKIIGVAAGAGAVTGVAVKKAAGKSKAGKVLAAIAMLIVFVLVLSSGLLYYFNIAPLNFELGNGNFKYYSFPNVTYSDGDLRVHFLNVGQGDCILIELPDGKNMLIDGGNNRKAVEEKIVNYLKDFDIDTIHYGMLTHTDADHCGAMDAVISSDEITFLRMYQPLVRSDSADCYVLEKFDWYMANQGSGDIDDSNRIPALNSTDGFNDRNKIQLITTGVYRSFIEAVAAEKDAEGNPCEVVFSYQEQVISGEGYKITLYSPNYDLYSKITSAQEKNDVSPMMILEFNGTKILLTGDGDSKAETNFIKNAGNGADIDILKVGHHGGKESTSETFLNATTPKFSVISVGSNSYNHPTTEVLNRLKAVKSIVFTTQDKGNIVFTASGSKTGWKFFTDDQTYGTAEDYDEKEGLTVAWIQRPLYEQMLRVA